MAIFELEICILEALALPEIMIIENQNTYPWTEGMIKDSFNASHEFYGLRIGKQLIAYTILSMLKEEAEILNIAVDKAFRQQGYGKKLLQHILYTADQYHTMQIFLEVRSSNLAAIKLYEKLGFKQIGLRKNYYPRVNGREDAAIYNLSLK